MVQRFGETGRVVRKPGTGAGFVLRALRHRNFRLYFAGQGVSLIGTWLQQTAMGWLVYRLTNSAFLLGVVGFTGLVPAFVFTPLAGVLADRFDRRKLLILTQLLAMVQALTLGALALTGVVAFWQIVPLSVFLGVVNALDAPVRQAFVLDMVERREDLGNAIALNSSMFNGARLVGPSLAGMLIAATGEGLCFVINGLSYLAVVGALLLMRTQRQRGTERALPVLREMREGIHYAAHSEPIRALLLYISVVSLVGMPYLVLMPVFARDILHGGPHTLGFLMASAGLGALAGALTLAARSTVVGLGRWIVRATCAFGLGLMSFGLSRAVWLSYALLALTGFGMMVSMASCNTMLQTIAEDDKRGRVMSLYTMAFMGMMPFGNLLSGALASKVGAPATLVLCGGVCMALAAVSLRQLPRLRKGIQPIYARLGLAAEGAPLPHQPVTSSGPRGQ
ncbi:MAG: MFS transporter [candidate division KSB1 bacterium]|nr:MFS transporter [candidate division KSB1 bacterium]MDZ7391730.1 MFS transporter [candidate division KSB1 bacterium]